MISTIDALILGLVEGFTEFLPVSSTAHLILTNLLLGNTLHAQTIQTLEIAIQGGAILAVVVFFYSEFFSYRTVRNLLLGSIPTLTIAFILKDQAEFLLSSTDLIAWALIIGGVILIVVEYVVTQRQHAPTAELATSSVFWMGFSQSLALIPGVSRSGASIVTGLLLGARKEDVVHYSFLLAVPIIGAATLYSLLAHPETITDSQLLQPFCVAFATAFISALCVIKFFLAFVRRFSFVPFGVYRIIVGCMILFFI